MKKLYEKLPVVVQGGHFWSAYHCGHSSYQCGHSSVYPASRHVSSLVVQSLGCLIGASITHRTNRAGRVACGE